MFEVEVTSNLDIAGQPLRVANQTGGVVGTQEFADDPQVRQIAASLSRWVDNARSAAGLTSMFDRGVFTPPENPYDEMRAARNALRYDSVVSGVAEVTEAFAFQGVKWESPNADEADIFNQMARDQNLDDVVRKMWREEFSCAQVTVAKLWGWNEYQVRGKTVSGNKRKKTAKIWAPLQLRVLDSCKVVPVGVGPLGGEGLAWQATPGEIGYYYSTYSGETVDPLMATFFQGPYEPTYLEAGQLGRLGVQTSRLLVMNPEWVFRHTITKPDYERYPDIRLKSVFKLLDLKQQLMQRDRAMLIGSANYILLVRKGDKDIPAQAEEIDNLKGSFNFLARLPVIIADHRLQIDIIAPKQDFVLSSEAYEVLDSRILSRLLGTLSTGQRTGGRSENQETLSATVGRVMENRRHMLKRTLELQIARAVVRHPKNAGIFETEPNLVYAPRTINLGFDTGYIQALVALRTQREVSRETILETFGLDQTVEAMRMEMEEKFYNKIFRTEIPYSKGMPEDEIDPALDPAGSDKENNASGGAAATKDGANADPGSRPASGQPSSGQKKPTPNNTPEDPSISGRRGGRPRGGGQSTKSPASMTKPKTGRGNPRTNT